MFEADVLLMPQILLSAESNVLAAVMQLVQCNSSAQCSCFAWL